jgi:small subunit ribosomal protein S29
MLTRIVESQALKFPHNDNDPFRIFGLPRNILVEVRATLHAARRLFELFCSLQYRLLSKPCSVIRSVTIDAINKLDAASEKESWQSRVVLSAFPGYS